MTIEVSRRASLRSYIAIGLLAPCLFAIDIRPAHAESLQELAQRSHIHGISFNRAGGSAELVIATHHGMFAVMRDGSVTQISTTQDMMAFSADPAAPLRYFGSGHPAGGGNLGFLESRDGGATWSQLSAGYNGPVDFHSLAVSAADPKTIYGAFDGIQMSADGGVTWQITGPIPDGLVQLAASSEDAGRIFAATESGLKVSGDSGQSWSNAAFDGEIISAVRIERDGTVYAFVLGRGLLKSKESSLGDWMPLSNSFGKAIPLHITTKPDNSSQMAVSTQTSEVLESQDGGRTWRLFGQP